ncbi:MAG: ATP-grasp domain-containing protein [Enterobacteriaceae bacterium]|nr:ATP-grasp domain-containing protein [Enterobacteriaceae bacterium]
MRKVLILYRGNNKAKKEDRKRNYELLYKMGAEKGIKFYRGNIKHYQNGKFKIVQSFENNLWIKKINIKPDIIIDKCVYSSTEKENNIKKEISKKNILINDIYFNRIFSSKFITYSIFSDYMPLTFIAYNRKDLINKIDEIKSEKVVIKPDDGLGGRGVFIIDKNEVKKMTITKIKFPTIVQEFINSSKGIKGIVKGVHDLRIIFINHKPVLLYTREPVGKSLVANVSLGGKRNVVDLKRIPKKLEKKYKTILNRLKVFKNVIYSIDFIFNEKQDPFVMEINSPPSFHLEDKKNLTIFYKKIIKFLIEVKL